MMGSISTVLIACNALIEGDLPEVSHPAARVGATGLTSSTLGARVLVNNNHVTRAAEN